MKTSCLTTALLAACMLAAAPASTADETLAAPADFQPEYTDIPVTLYKLEVRTLIRYWNKQAYTDAFPLAYKAARWGEKLPQLMLGLMYLQGMGTEPDPVKGLAWLTLAEESGWHRWEELADRAREAVTPEERRAGEALAEELRPWYGMQATGVTCPMRARVGTHVRLPDCGRNPGLNDFNYQVYKEFPL